MKKNKSIEMSILKIKEVSFYMNEASFISGEMARVELKQKFSYNLKLNLIVLTLMVDYIYDKIDANNSVLTIAIENTFFINNLNQFYKDKDLQLPEHIYFSIVGMSISHARALLSLKTSGTLFNQALLPLMPSDKVAKAFFPDKIKSIK